MGAANCETVSKFQSLSTCSGQKELASFISEYQPLYMDDRNATARRLAVGAARFLADSSKACRLGTDL